MVAGSEAGRLAGKWPRAAAMPVIGKLSLEFSENVVADTVGHEKQTMTYGLYSGGGSLAVKAEVSGKLAY